MTEIEALKMELLIKKKMLEIQRESPRIRKTVRQACLKLNDVMNIVEDPLCKYDAQFKDDCSKCPLWSEYKNGCYDKKSPERRLLTGKDNISKRLEILEEVIDMIEEKIDRLEDN